MGVTYLDNAATSWPKPPQVGEAMARFLNDGAANAGRGGHRMAREAGAVMDTVRRALAQMLGAESPDRVVLTSGCTDALNTAIHGVVMAAADAARREGRGRPHAALTVMEHNAVRRPLGELEARGVIDVTLIPCDGAGRVDPQDVLDATNERTALVCVQHASNVTGAIQPVEQIGSRLRSERPEAIFLVDAAQTVGAVPVDVVAMGADLLAFPGHKSLLGPTGTGALYVGPRAYDESQEVPRMYALKQGGTGGDSGRNVMPRPMPRHFEPGTPNLVGFAGLGAALAALPAGAIAHERELCALVREGIAGLGARVLGPGSASESVGLVNFVIDGTDPLDIGGALDASFDVAVRPGVQCAPGAHEALGTFPRGGVRVSPGAYSTREDVERLLDALGQIVAS